MRSVEKKTMKSTESTASVGQLSLQKEHWIKMFRGSKNVLTGFVLGLVFLAFAQNSYAQQQVNIHNFDGEDVFKLNFFNPADGDFGEGASSARVFTQAEITAVTAAAQYWADVLKPRGTMPGSADAGGQSVSINIGTFLDNNATGNPLDPISNPLSSDPSLVHLSTALLGDGITVDQSLHGIFKLGSGFNTTPTPLSQVGRVANDVTTTAIHEFGHILGITSLMELDYIDQERLAEMYRFPQELTRWQSRLRDSNGNTSVPGAYPNVDGKPIDYDSTHGKQYLFDMGDPNSLTQPANFTFVGQNTLEVYYDGNEQLIRDKGYAGVGVPLQGLVPNDPLYILFGGDRWIYNNPNTMSHIDARNSVMSWQMYRNYPMFLEVELATLQDMGYNINRRDFYGRSFYVDGDGTPLYNSAEFNSLSAYGIGAHLFAKNLNIVQTGAIFAGGPGAAGIRVDGVGNTLTIAGGTTVSAGLPAGYVIPTDHIDSFRNYGITVSNDGTVTDGVAGTGLLVSYGKDHTIIHRGTIETLATTGIAVRFDFGTADLGAQLGSYAFDPYYGYMDEANRTEDDIPIGGYPEDIQGPLVKSFNVTGTIKGGKMGTGIPHVTPGGNDRIITRGNDPRFTGDPLTDDIFRIFENGHLMIPREDFFLNLTPYYPRIAADPPQDVDNKDIASVFINTNDGSAVIIYSAITHANRYPPPYTVASTEQTPDFGVVAAYRDDSYINHIFRVDPSLYSISEENVYERDEDGNATVNVEKTVYTITNKKDDKSFTIEIDKNGKMATNISRDTAYVSYAAVHGATEYDPKAPDVAVITYEQDGSVRVQPPPMEGLADLLNNYLIGYVDGRLIMRTLEENEAEPWMTYIAPDQDVVTFLSTGGAAIYIAGDDKYDVEASASLGRNVYQGGAHVETINIMNGSVIEGDIISHYNSISYPVSEDRGTTLTFGLKADAQGKATSSSDSDFHFVFKDDINYYETMDRAYINDRPEFDADLARWGNFDYDENIGYIYVGPGQGRYKSNDSWRVAGKIDLHFAGGYTEFQAAKGTTRYYIDSVLIDPDTTFSLSSVFIDQANHPIIPSLYAKGNFVNNGRFSGEGEVWVGAERIYNFISIGDLFNTLSENAIGFWGDGTFTNNGTIAPGPNNGYGEIDRYINSNSEFLPGRKTGTLAIAGNLDLSSRSSVYEVTITDKRTTAATSPGWDSHPHWVKNRAWMFEDINTGEFAEYLTLEYSDPESPWNIDPVTGLPVNNERETIGGGWGYGDSDRLVVSGKTTLGGTLVVHVTPGDYSPDPTTYTIIQSEDGYASGTNFENIEHYIGFLTFEPYNLNMSNTYINPYDSRELQFTVIRDPDYFKKHGKTVNEIAAATAIDNSLFDSYKVAFSLGDDRNTDSDLRNMYHQIAASIRANSLMINLWSPSEVLFPRIGWGNGQMETGNRGRVNWNRIAGKKAGILCQAPGHERVGSLWGEMMNTTLNADSDGNADGYRFNRTGLMVGSEWSLTPYSAIGAIASYHNSTLKQAGDKIKSDDYILGTYFVAAPFNTLEFKAYLGLGIQEYDSDRRIYNADIITDRVPLGNGYTDVLRGVNDRYIGDTRGNSFNLSLELAKPLELHPTFILRPTLGLDVQHVWQNGFTENDFSDVSASYGSNIYALHYSRAHYNRGLLRTGFSSETSGPRGGIRMRAFYVSQIAGDRYPGSTAAFATGGERFTVRGVDLGKSYLHFGVGANYWLDGERTSSLFFDYDANIYNVSHKVNAHIASLGLLQKF